MKKRPLYVNFDLLAQITSSVESSTTHLTIIARHVLAHTGRKPHKCKACDNTFPQSQHLQKHGLTHTIVMLMNIYFSVYINLDLLK